MKILRRLILIHILGCTGLFASGDPYSGYTNKESYFLPYSTNGDGKQTSFDPDNTGDVFVSFSLPESMGTKTNFNVQVDTGSRGFYASSTALGTNFTNADSYSGQINLSSSGRVFQGDWTPTTMVFDVTNLETGLDDKVTSSVTVLVIQSLTCDSNHTSATFTTTTESGIVIADKIGTTKTNSISFTGHTVTVPRGYSISYAKNTNLAEEENFGVGFYLGGATNATTTGPIGNNQNQCCNPLINLTDTNIVAGYIIEAHGIQLGLATNVSGFAYTRLNPTGFTSDNSVPDWQTPMGTVVNGGTNRGVTNIAGSIVMDSGIDNAYFSAAGLGKTSKISNNLTIQLMNSGGAADGGVGYNIDQKGTSLLNPTSIDLSRSGTNGIYSQNQSPYGNSYFNTGRNIFLAFDMLYDAQNGYMGLLTNDYGSSLVNSNIVYFNAQADGFPTPIPMPTKAQTIKFAVIPTKVYGSPSFNLTATATSGLPVTDYTSSNTNVATVSSNTVTIVGAGLTTITANQAGNLIYKPAPPVNRLLTVNKAAQTITFPPIPPQTFGASPLSLTASSSSLGTVNFASSNKKVATILGNTLTIVGAGLTTITASVPMSTNYTAAIAHQVLKVAKASQTINFTTPSTESFVKGSQFALAGTAEGGEVSFKSSKPTVISIKGATATIQAIGSTTITATQIGNANYEAAMPVPIPVLVTPTIQIR